MPWTIEKDFESWFLFHDNPFPAARGSVLTDKKVTDFARSASWAGTGAGYSRWGGRREESVFLCVVGGKQINPGPGLAVSV